MIASRLSRQLLPFEEVDCLGEADDEVRLGPITLKSKSELGVDEDFF